LYYQHDQLGSTRLLTDSTGGVVATYSYDPYGQLTTHTGTADTSLRFAGQYQDPTGLYYLQARYYDPATAQFLTVDPLAGLTQQPYSYAGNNPLTFTDPLGLCIICWKTISRVANDVTNVAGVVAVAAVVTVLVVGTDGAAAPILLSIAGYAGDVALAGSVTAGVSTCYGAATTPGANFDDCYVAAGDALIAGATFGVGRSVEYSILEAQHLAAEDMQRAFLEYAAATATGPAITAGRWGLNKLLNAWETTGATAC
jgi:RHS repeat-associated protein